ncbi:ATP-binding cassette domain-containing protein [Actinomadura sp. NAK00032]|uniref:ABC transporter ATP-binding protein n=1 Tax=Actinomadura sp. NAK00032 TaxID=2742128 RepID=UPI00158FAEC4|nr:ATP-binding cassette domain-containing protein [Actinomadura sp. NAK00032]QKW36946.1 ATP-binding cassette domain-containing protein [Actinomadura sp. NAK00032]
MRASSEPAGEAPDLVISAVHKRFQGAGDEQVTALDGVDLAIAPGTMVSVIGSNGAGKSTMLSVVAGNVLPDRGRVLVRGEDVTGAPSWRRVRKISRVRQNPQDNMVSMLTIEENFALALAGKRGRFRMRTPRRGTVREMAAEALRPLGMGLENRLSAVSGTLSGGQRQAIAVAMASLGSPALMLLDEHVAALDPNSAARVNEATERIVREQKITTLMVTHDMGHALHLADRLVMMHAGKIVLDLRDGALTDVTPQHLQERFAALSGGTLSDSALLSVPGGTQWEAGIDG